MPYQGKFKGPSDQNKNPYELRLEILHLAQHIVERKSDTQLALLHIQNDTEGSTSIDDESVSLPRNDVSEILEVAKELNDFVSNG